MSNDPFASIVPLCQISSFQEEILRICPFARQSELFSHDSPPSPDTQVDPTGIVMLSLRDSSNDDERFQTPPEEHLLVSSEEQRETPAVDSLTGQQINGANDGGVGGDTVPVDDLGVEAGRAVDLSKDSDNLGFSGPQLTQVIDYKGSSCEVFECELEKFGVFRRKSSDDVSVPKKLRSCAEIVHLGSPDGGLDNNLNVNTQVLESESGEINRGLGLSGDTENVNSQGKNTMEGGSRVRKNHENGSCSKNVMDLDKFKYVACSGNDPSGGKAKDVEKQPEMPSSLTGERRNASAKNELLKILLDGLGMVSGELDYGSKDKDVDFIETAKRRGMTFPRPRWKAPEGS